jgi:hypothetical protein
MCIAYQQNCLGATRVIVQERRCVDHFAIDDNPTDSNHKQSAHHDRTYQSSFLLCRLTSSMVMSLRCLGTVFAPGLAAATGAAGAGAGVFALAAAGAGADVALLGTLAVRAAGADVDAAVAVAPPHDTSTRTRPSPGVTSTVARLSPLPLPPACDAGLVNRRCIKHRDALHTSARDMSTHAHTALTWHRQHGQTQRSRATTSRRVG